MNPAVVYLDTCALNWLTDPLTQRRIIAESEAVIQVLDRVALGHAQWLASDALHEEITNNPDAARRAHALGLLTLASNTVNVTASTMRQAQALKAVGFDPFDALHLALCETFTIPILLTVDDRFIARAARRNSSVTEVLNPVDWVRRKMP